MPSVVQLKRHPPKAVIRAAIESLSPPPADHNISGLPSLSPEETVCVEQARAALATMRRTFEFWMVIARALKVLEDKTHRMGGRTFERLCEREGLGGRRADGGDVLSRSRVWRLNRILARLPEVEAWRASLTDRQRFKWASPESVVRHCPPVMKPKACPRPDRGPRLEYIEPTDSADVIAEALVGMFLPRKAEAIFRAGLAKLAARELHVLRK
jgi:hypothetical protein